MQTMGNTNSMFGLKRFSKNKQNPIGSFANNSSHDGIKTIEAVKSCSFSRKADLCIRIITWNMNGKVSYEDLVELLGKDRKFDLLVVGLQEAPKENVAQFLETATSPTHVLLGKAKLQSIHLYLFGPKNSHALVKELKAEKHSVGGCGGLIGRNKGAVAIRFNYDDIKMVFISCHLSAHAKKVDQRNTELRHIANSLLSRDKRTRDLTVWLGDLNYRIQDASNRPVRSLIHNHLQSVLVSKDQLLQEAERGEIFKGYSEGTLGFKPTYKYNVGSNDYDTSHKVRVPAWTDRILFKIQDTDNIQATLHSYDSIDQIYSSDHKPVKADLCLKWVNN
ncbi:PREDICTED: type IV inositol polyphosphate 5-phosphatase 11-like [Camelina sativa]|uniref:Type IV inositol polyphosphate 5-phosphatase 11-like n=1 Tax=Camelina sativa TaxID=90675 RepID=A0ABM0YFU1_CAMSA|nr:PREDICTED: type IV inositol polyphosphate 5-phosphatase 11-like [Camelina sativa]XP_019099415.1 PREDICTED: type IV inositol polyphosphate 5-phosphatase 11-like [Camelina sativa]XP_019099416.1 PREDICTED: type IV inositol polyphosphate 5-phosphatase 11-like [Camelina sativa]XP_019099417.1 PREDICTED: type IV inositol polyphosphate 5-phosphatase 11-like [Camelina sativa]